MQLEAKKYLYDIKRAADLIESFSAGKSFDDYSADVQARTYFFAPGLSASSKSSAKRSVRSHELIPSLLRKFRNIEA